MENNIKSEGKRPCDKHECNVCEYDLHAYPWWSQFVFIGMFAIMMLAMVGVSLWTTHQQDEAQKRLSPPYCYREWKIEGKDALNGLTKREFLDCPK